MREVLAMREEIGLPVLGDGEMRRESFHSELTAACDGSAGVDVSAWLLPHHLDLFDRAETRGRRQHALLVFLHVAARQGRSRTAKQIPAVAAKQTDATAVAGEDHRVAMAWIRIIRASLTLLVGKRLASLMLGAQLALDLGLGPGSITWLLGVEPKTGVMVVVQMGYSRQRPARHSP